MSRLLQTTFVAVIIAVTTSTTAAIDNGGFESGDFTSWTTWQDVYAGAWFGGIQVVNSHLVTTPDTGSYFAKIPAASKMSQTLSWQTGDTISFRYAFDGTPTFHNDRAKYALFQLFEDGNANAIYNSEHIARQSLHNSGDTNDWRDYSYEFTTSGTGHFDIGLWWWVDPGHAEPGYFYVDQVMYVPEPATVAIVMLGALGVLRKR